MTQTLKLVIQAAAITSALVPLVLMAPMLAFADDRYPQPEYHCYGNPHSDIPTGNPHDPGINDKSNPHDLLIENGGECELNTHSPK